MGEIVDIESELTKDNPKISGIDIKIYADAMRTYWEATKNITLNGVICSHPRTGTPLENPYMKIRTQQAAILSKLPRIKSDRVLKLLQEASEA